MILDTYTEFADATALGTGGTGLQLVGNQIPLDGLGLDGNSDGLYLVIQITTAVTGTSSTVEFILASDATAAIATDGSATQHYATAAIPEATLVAGYQVCAVELPRGTYENYLGILANVGAAALTAGAINAFLTNDPKDWSAVPEGNN